MQPRSRDIVIMKEIKEVKKATGVRSRDFVDDTDVDDADPRQCTDRCCFIVFLAYIAVMVHIFVYSLEHGNINKLVHGIDWQGQICGVSPNVTDKSLLYWCPDPLGLSLGKDGICVSSCPSATSTKHKCPGTPHQVTTHTAKSNGDETVTLTVSRDLTWTQDVATSNILGMYCLPNKQPALLSSVSQMPQLSGTTSQIVLALKGMYDSWIFLVCVAIFAMIAGFIFLFVLTFFVQILVYLVLSIVFLFLLGGGGYMVWMAFNPDYNLYTSYCTPDDAKKYALITGIVVLVLWVLYMVAIACAKTALKVTILSIKKACETLQDLPTLAFAPLVQIAVQSIIVVVVLYGVGWVASMGKIASQPSPVSASGVSVSGVGRSLQLQDWQKTYLAVFAFGAIWILETTVAWGQYALSYCVVIHTLNKDELANPVQRMFILGRGYANGLIFHLGTLAFGGFIIGVLKVLTAVCAYISKQLKTGDGSSTIANKVASIMCCCCTWFLGFLTEVMEKINEMVYVDCAICSSNYFGAATNVASIISKFPESIMLGRGIIRVIRYLGTLALGGGCTFLAHLALTSTQVSSGLESLHKGASAGVYTSSTLGTTVASGVICFLFSSTFMMAFDQISNALIYTMLFRKVRFNIDFDDFFQTGYDEMEEK